MVPPTPSIRFMGKKGHIQTKDYIARPDRWESEVTIALESEGRGSVCRVFRKAPCKEWDHFERQRSEKCIRRGEQTMITKS